MDRREPLRNFPRNENVQEVVRRRSGRLKREAITKCEVEVSQTPAEELQRRYLLRLKLPRHHLHEVLV